MSREYLTRAGWRGYFFAMPHQWAAILALGAMLTATGCSNDPVNAFPANPPSKIHDARPAKLVVPDDYTPDRPWPLVVLLHGFSANGTLQDVIFGLSDRATEYGFILVVPEGTEDQDGDQFWNATDECCDQYDTGIDDAGYLRDLVATAAETVNIDPSRVWFAGHSNGGYMSARMVCDGRLPLAGIVSLAGGITLDPDSCTPISPLKVLHIHGTLDDVVPYDSTMTEANEIATDVRLRSRGAQATVDHWVDKLGCNNQMTSTTTLDLISGVDGAETDDITWTDCPDGSTVRYWRVNGGDHILADVNDTFRNSIAAWVSQ